MRAETRFAEIGITERDEAVRLSGQLTNDGGEPVGGANVLLEVSPSDGEWTPCRDWTGTAGRVTTVQTDAQGRFCVQAASIANKATVEARFLGDRYHRAVLQVAPLARTERTIVLDFDATTLEIPLDRPTYSLNVAARATDGAAFGEHVRVSVLHTSTTGRTQAVGGANVPVGGRTRIELDTTSLGSPGPGELRVKQVGTSSTRTREAIVAIRKVANVTLSAPHTLAAIDPSAGADVPIGVTSIAGAVPEGWVEALIDDRPVGMGNVAAGAARVRVRFDAPRARSIDLVLRYVPHDPWWRPSEALVVTLPVDPPSAWKRIAWLLPVLVITLWILRAWRRPGRVVRPSTQPAQPTGRPDVRVVAAEPRQTGWSGIVCDAHDGRPIANAVIEALQPTFGGSGVLASSRSGPDGTFALGVTSGRPPELGRLRVTADHHSELTRPLPPFGTLAVSMITRRRALLNRLVGWAQKKGHPWSGSAEPTPGHIARTARARADPTAEAWARGVEAAAYGTVVPDEQHERALIEAEPGVSGAANDR